MPSAWKRVRYRFEWLGLSIAARLVPLLSRKTCFRLAHFLGAIISVVDRPGRNVALSNLEAAFGSQMSLRERKKIGRASFQHFAATVIDLLWSPRLSRENVSRYVEFENFDEIARVTGPERSFIMACYHYSSFEWLSIAGGYAEIIGTIIAQEFKNPLLDPIFKRIRERPGHEFVPRDRGIVRLYKALRRKRTTAMLVDLNVPPGQGAVIIDCFGLKTSVTSAPAWLHESTDAPIIPAHCEPLADGRYRVVFHSQIKTTPEMTHQEITQACWDSFEPYVRKNPAPWLWMYKHWRYRPAKADRSYPFYANVSERFDDLLAMQAGIPIPGRRKKRHAQFDRAQRRGTRSGL